MPDVRVASKAATNDGRKLCMLMVDSVAYRRREKVLWN